ncbi:MAG: hypothetical protein ACYCWE_07600 [Eubacteriales bacterium]
MNMLKYIANVIVFTLILAAAALLGVNATVNNKHCATNEYMQACREKHSHLAEPQPQIVLMGGSSVSFGIDSSKIAEAFDMDVVNMGLHAGLDIYFMLNSIRDEVKTDDIVLLLLEFNCYTNPSLYSEDTVYRYVKYYPRMLKYVDAKYFGLKVLSELPSAIRQGMNNLLSGNIIYNGVYDRWGFNEYGDLTSHWEFPGNDASQFGSHLYGGETVSDEKLAFLDEFARYVTEERGVKAVYVSFPPVPRGQINLEALDMIMYALSQYDSYTVISNPYDYIFAKDLFYDTYYHLCGEGAQHRSEKLVNDLKKYF